MTIQPEGRPRRDVIPRRRDPNDPLGYGDQIVNLTPEFDFSPEAATTREVARQLDSADSFRALNRAANELEANPRPVAPTSRGARFAGATTAARMSFYQDNAERILEREKDRRTIPDYFMQYPSVQRAIKDMRDAGIEFSEEDLRNAAVFGVVNDAADKIIKATQAGVPTDAKNVMMTLADTNVVLASLVPAVVESKLQELASDPNLMEQIANTLVGVIDWTLTPLVAANEEVMHRIRAGQWNVAQNPTTPEFTVGHILYGMFSNPAIDATRDGQFNEEYIQQIAASGEYTPLQVEIARDVMLAAANGDRDAIINTWADKYVGNVEAAKIFGDIMYSRPTGNTQELLRQIDSAYLGNTGQVFLGAADESAEFDTLRGEEWRQNAANVLGLTSSIVFDPTLVFSKFGRAYQAVRWNLAQLAPGESASSVLTKLRYGRLPAVNPAYRYFNSFANDLNDLDAAEKAAAAATGKEATKLQSRAAAMRQRMSRQYNEMPEELIEEFRTSPWRNVDGKFDVEHIAAAIDDMNDAYTIALGDVSERIAVAAAARDALVDTAIKMQFKITESEVAKRLAQMDAADAARKVKELEKERSGLKSFTDRLASTNMRGTPLVPRMSLVREARIAAVNALAVHMGQKKAIKLVDDFLQNDGEAASLAQALSDNAVTFGAATRANKMPLDTAGRMFSSIPIMNSVSLEAATDAREVYRYARAFLPKRTAEMVADAFRRGDVGSRRLLLSGLVRTAAASRGLTLTDDELGLILKPEAQALVTGTKKGEKYGVDVATGLKPSERAAAIASGQKPMLTPGTVSLSADSAGVQHALHLSQTAERIALPTLRDFEALRPGWQAATGRGLERVTNWWSLGTLYGFRFSMRNAIEEVGLYWLLGGGMLDLYRGRKMDQAIRAARPRIFIEMGKDGEPEVVLRTSLGMIANKAEAVSRYMKHKGWPEWMAELIFRQADPDALKAAGVALSRGDAEAFSRLAIESLAAQKVFGFSTNALSAEDKLAFKYLVGSTHGMALLDEIGEAGLYLQSGGYPAYVNSMYGMGNDTVGLEFGRLRRDVSFGDYGNIAPVGVSQGQEVYGLAFWWRELQNTFGDGPIGETAVRYLDDPVKAKAEIAKIIREDRTIGYKEKFSRIRSDADIDQFADDYFENVFQHFTKQDGTLNRDLAAKFLEIGEDGDLRASWWKLLTPEDVQGLTREQIAAAKASGFYGTKVSRKTLADIPVADRPAFIFGREVQNSPMIPMPMNEAQLLSGDRVFAWMGRQNARISRDPIFLANYVDQFRQAAPARQSLAKALAEARSRKTGSPVNITDDDIALADRMYAEQSMDNAFNLTLSFVDNPANRSNLAWKIRNFSRYYRATEDFYRRMGRVVRTSPESLWKAALTYQLLGDYGFTYTDDNGDRYFAYPGNEIVQKALLTGLNIPGTEVTTPGILGIMGIPAEIYQDIQPFSMGGRVLGLTPSADPNSLFVSLAGPITAPVAGILGQFPQLSGVRAALLGPYSQSSGNVVVDTLRAAIPAGVWRVLPLINEEYLDTQVGSSAFDAVAFMQAEGLLDELTINGKPMLDAAGNPVTYQTVSQQQFSMSDQMRAADAMSVVFFTMRLFGSYNLPAAPQNLSTSASSFAQRNGVDSINDAFFDMYDKRKDDPNAFVRALGDFFVSQLKTEDGLTGTPYMLPFIPGQSKYDTDQNPVAAMAQIRATDDVAKWLVSDETKNLFEKAGDVAWFLAPKTGEFTWQSHTLVNLANNVRTPKGDWEKYQDLFAFQGRQTASIIRQAYAEDLANAVTPEEVKAVKEQMDADLDANKAANPAYAAQLGPNTTKTSFRIDKYLADTRNMIAYLRERDGKLSDDASLINASIEIYTEYKTSIAQFAGTSSERSTFKARQEALMASDFQDIKNVSPNAKLFIEAILESDPDYTFGVNNG